MPEQGRAVEVGSSLGSSELVEQAGSSRVRTLSGLLADQASLRSDAAAVVDVARTWTWSEIAVASGQVMAALIDCGVQPGDRVGVHLNKSAEGFAAMHAVVSVGAIAVPLDPGSRAARLARICDHMQIAIVVSHAPRKRTLLAMQKIRPLVAVIGVDLAADLRSIDVDELANFEPAAPRLVDVDAPSYIITTSGTTGEPKGMVHTHRSALAYADMTLRTYGLRPDDRVSDIAPHHFDISTHSLWSVPLAGATNVVISEPYQRLPASHSQRLQDERVTYWYSVPFLLHQLVLRGDLENRDLSALRWVHFGGEVISPLVIADFMAAAPNARFANIFGPAETNQCSVAIFDEAPDPDQMLSVGRPLDHTDIRIIDPDANTPDLANVVQSGEMWASTPQLMEGYWQQTELNARVIVESDGKCWYRSGDLVSVADDGNMTFHGRVDHQVKVRGYRVELEGVEMELEQLPDVDHVVVAVSRLASGEDELVAGLLGTASDFDESSFLHAAASALPTYAVPTRTVTIDVASFTGSGKLDRRLLREHILDALRIETRKVES
jgi:amino acid adenylation domain-containing protein